MDKKKRELWQEDDAIRQAAEQRIEETNRRASGQEERTRRRAKREAEEIWTPEEGYRPARRTERGEADRNTKTRRAPQNRRPQSAYQDAERYDDAYEENQNRQARREQQRRRAAAKKREQQKRYFMLGGIGVLAAIVVGVCIGVSQCGFGKSNPAGTVPERLDGTADASVPETMTNAETQEETETGTELVVPPLTEEETTAGSENGADENGQQGDGNGAEMPEGGETVYTTTVVNVRSIPDTTGEILGKLEAGTAIVRTADENGWSTIDYNGTTAYVSSEFLTTTVQESQTSASGTAVSSMSMYPVHEGQWDLASLDNTPVYYGNDDSQRQDNMVPSDWAFYEKKWGQFNVDWIQDINQNVIYLTMDDGFGNDETIQVLDTLKERNMKIVFFITKRFLDDRPELVQRMIDEGHTIGNHTCNHKNMPSLGIEEETAEIMDLQNAMIEKFGYEMKLFRFPQGIFSDQSLGLVENLGFKTVFWSYAYNDYSDEQPDVAESLDRALRYLHPGAVYLLHASSSTNAAFLGDFIDGAIARGYTFGTYPLDAN